MDGENTITRPHISCWVWEISLSLNCSVALELLLHLFLSLAMSFSRTHSLPCVQFTDEKDAVLSDSVRDGSDMDNEGETGHLPTRLLNLQTDHDMKILSDDDLPFNM